MNKYAPLLIFFFFSPFFSVCAEEAGFHQSEDNSIFHAGVILPLTGPYASFGSAGRIGIELALEKIENKKIKFHYEDSENNPAKAVTAFNRLTASNHADALIVLSTACSSAILPLAEARGIPIFIWTASEKLSTGHPNAIRLMASGKEQGNLMAEKFREDSGKIVFFSGEGEFFQAVKDGFWQSFSKSQSEATIDIPADSVDFKTEIVKAKSSGAKKLGICVAAGQTSTLIKQIKELFPEAGLFGCHSASTKDVQNTLKDAKMSLWFVEGLVSNSFENEFKKIHEDTSGIWVAAAYHDVALLLSQNILKQSGKDLSDELAGKCIEKSAFRDKSCIITKHNDTFMDVKLGVTTINGGLVMRNLNN